MVFYYNLRQQQSPVQPQGQSLLFEIASGSASIKVSEGARECSKGLLLFFHPDEKDCLKDNKNTFAFFLRKVHLLAKLKEG